MSTGWDTYQEIPDESDVFGPGGAKNVGYMRSVRRLFADRKDMREYTNGEEDKQAFEVR